MKTTLTPLIFILLLLTSSCSKEEDCDNPVDCLPPATQIGANTAGCLVNGEVLLPGGKSLGSGSVLHSQFLVYNNSYMFSVTLSNIEGAQYKLVQIRGRGVKLIENTTYPITIKSDTTVSAMYTIDSGLTAGYLTNNNTNGELVITKIDEDNKILSGTFWFDASNNEGEIVQIREGRFDVRYN